MPDSSSLALAALQAEIEKLEREIDTLRCDARDPKTPTYGRIVIDKVLREIELELIHKKQELMARPWRAPGLIAPDLVGTIQLRPNHAENRFSVALLVTNIGLGRATGPFEIHLSVTLLQLGGGEVVEIFQPFHVPSGYILYPPVVGSTGVSAASNEYVAGWMEIAPMHYIDEPPGFKYRMDFFIDPHYQIAESDKRNNQGTVSWWTHSTGGQRGKPIVVTHSAPKRKSIDKGVVS